jgi:hypothetical protein
MTRKGHCASRSHQISTSSRETRGREQSKKKNVEKRTENKSLLTEKQNAHGTGRPSGPRTTHCIVIDVAVDSKACLAKDS